MYMLCLRRIFILFICESIIFSPFVQAEQLSLPATDLTAPEVSHQAIEATLQEGASLQLRATVTDNVEVKSVTLFYRTVGTTDYKSVIMHRQDQSDDYAVTLGKNELVSPGIEYYIQAVDIAGNTLLHGYSFSPLKVSVASELGPVAGQGEVSDTVVSQPQKKKTNTWIWIGLGALVVGVIAAAASGGGGGDDNPPAGKTEDTTITVTAPTPGSN